MLDKNGKQLFLSDLVTIYNEDGTTLLEAGDTVLATIIAKYEEESQVTVVTLGEEAKTLVLSPDRIEQLESPIGEFHTAATPEAFATILENAEQRLAAVSTTKKGRAGTRRAKVAQGTGSLDI